MMLQTRFDLTTLKLFFIAVLFFFTGPVVTHALAQAALHEEIEPTLAEDRRARRRCVGEAAIESFVNVALLTLLAVVTVAVIRQRSLFGVVILAGVYSFLMASVLIVLDAVDVAMTEASVGAGDLDRAAARHAESHQDHRDPPSAAERAAAPPRARRGRAHRLGHAGAAAVRHAGLRRSTRMSRRAISPNPSRRPAFQTSSPRCSPTTAATTRSARRR